MNIIKADYYRSEGRLLNEDDDKVRVTLDMDRGEYKRFKNTLEPLSSDAVLSEVIDEWIRDLEKEDIYILPKLLEKMKSFRVKHFSRGGLI